jgi:hypothetical protein
MFGTIAVSAMLAFYAVEERSPLFILLFAGAYLASSAYGFLQGAWPFACNMNAFAADERQRYDALRARVTASIVRVAELPNGYRVQVGESVTSAEAGEWMALEQRCCPFLCLTLELEDAGAMWLVLTGRPGVKDVLESEFAALRVNRP